METVFAARAAFVAAKVAHGDSHADTIATRAAYVALVGSDKIDICRNLANQPIFEALVRHGQTNLLAYTRAQYVIRTLRVSLFEDDELIWDGDIFERIGNREIVEFIDTFIKNNKTE